MTVSEAAVLVAVRRGEDTRRAIAQATGAASWWIDATVWGLLQRRVLVERDGRLVEA